MKTSEKEAGAHLVFVVGYWQFDYITQAQAQALSNHLLLLLLWVVYYTLIDAEFTMWHISEIALEDRSETSMLTNRSEYAAIGLWETRLHSSEIEMLPVSQFVYDFFFFFFFAVKAFIDLLSQVASHVFPSTYFFSG